MSLLQRALGELYQPQGGGLTFLRGTYSGKTVNVQTALGLVPVFSAVSQIAGAVGSLPLVTYRRVGDRHRERATNHRAWSMLHDLPNPEMAADEFWELVDSHLELWGNAFIWKKRDDLGMVRELWVLAPKRIQVDRDEQGRRRFLIDGLHPYGEDTILHIRGLGSDGLVGYSPIQMARNAIANAMAEEEFQGKFLKGDGNPRVILRHPNRLKDDAAKRLKASWDAIKSGGTAVLEEAIEVEKWTMPLDDAQFIEQMQFSDLRIAQLFVLPPGRLGAKTGDSLTYATTEQNGIDFVTYTLRRRLVRIAGAVNRDPSIFLQGQRFFCEFLIDALLQADIKTRYQAYMIGVNGGWLDPDEDVRPRENLPKRDKPAPPSDPEETDPEQGDPESNGRGHLIQA